ncbi:phage tail tip fiber protein [Pseudomonas putida]|uniref:phage tail tip fiber protein n=1 Tax=Pseudomonas putida TaxID=303 RepID=UPI003D01C5C6
MQGIFAGLTGAAKVSGASSSEPSSQTVRSSKAPVRFILGRASTGGVLAWVQEEPGDQTSGEWLHIVYVLSEGAIAGVDEIYVDERPLSELGANATSEVIINPTQVNAFLLEKCPDWRQEQIGRGLSFVRLSFKYDAEKFPSGIPDVRFVVRGRSDLYDPRNGAMGYSANTALLILWYLRNRCAIPDDEIIFESFASAANVCDETVVGPDSKYTPRYFAGAVIGADEKRNTVLDNLLSACAGTLIRVGGRWSLQVGAYYGPADFTINEDMVIGTVEGTTEVSNSDAINTMRGTFVDPAQAWAETDYPEVAIQDWIAKDGGELAESQSFAYVTDAYLAQRLANISLRRRRSGGSLAMPLNFNGYNCRPGRAVTVNLPSLNILGEFLVTEWTMGAADACKVTLKPYEQAIFDDAVGQPYDPLGFINLPVGGLAAVTGLVWTPSGAAEVVQGVLSWTPPLQTVLSYTVTIRRGTEVVQSLKVGGEASGCNINGLTSGVYAMSVIAFGPGTRSGEASISVNVGGPPVPESCAVFASVDSITLVPANLQHSLNGGTYEYFYATNRSAPIADAVYLGQGLTFTHTGLAFAKEYFYYVRSANAYGKSDFLFVPAATSSDPTQMLEVIAGQVTESALGKELLSRIDLVDMNGPGSVNERVGEVRNQLNEQVAEVNDAIETVKSSVVTARDELQQQLAAVDQEVDAARAELQQQINTVSALAGSLPYNKDKAYTLNQGVLGGDGKLYQALKAVPKNNPPPNATYWTDVGQAIVTAAGTATRVGKVETDVSTLNGTSTAQASKIEGLQSGLSTTNGNVTAAQQAAQAAATAAGAKGEVIYGTTAPAADKRLAQNLWIDTTGNANTPKRWNGSTWVAVTDKVATDAAAAAANALAVAQTKADAQAVQSVTTRVTDVEGTVSAQGQAMTGMQSSLTTTKQDVTAAQQAAQAAATAAGAKGEVIYGSTAPAADKRLTQNLWIDTTGNANTPKRWNGSTWVAVSDKVATDAAAAAAAANALAATKADASAVNLLTNRVSNAEGVLTSYSSDITQLKNGLSAAQSFVAGKAWEFTGATRGWFGTLTGSTFVAGPLFATAGNCPNLQCNFTPTFPGAENPFLRIRLRRRNTARAGAQMYWANEDGGLAEARRMPWTINTSTTDWQDIEIDLSGHAGWNGKNILAIRLDIMSASDTTGEIDIAYIAVGRRSIAASAEAVSSLSSAASDADGKLTSQGQSIVSLQNGLTTTNGNVTTAQQAAQAAATAAGAKGEVIYGSAAPAADKRLAQNLWIDTTGNANTPKRWNGSTWVTVTDKVATDAAAAAQSALTEVAKKADASTVQNLSNTVAQHGQDITAQGQAMTAIDAAIAEVGGENLLYNPTFNRVSAGDASVPDGWFLEGAATKNPSMVVSWLNSGEQAFRVAVTGVTNSSPYLSLVTHASQRPKVAGGQTVTSSVYARRMAEAGLLALRVIHQWYNEAGAVISAPANGFVPITVEGGRISFTSVAPADAVRVNVYFRIHSQTAAAVNGSLELARPQSEYGSRATGWRDNGQVSAGEIAANVSATSLLSGRVEQTEQGLVTHGQSIVTLQGGLTTTNQGVTSAQQAAQAAATAAGGKGEVIYGSTAPAADKRLTQNLWIDTSGNANTPKRWNGSTWVAVTDKVATDAAAAAANALSVAQSKADASVVQSLSTKVSDNEGKLTTQGQSITGLQNSLSTTNGNVTTAQQAAQAAATAAGAKGEVIYGSTAPATDKRLAQNLWIDTTGNANTPKRWSGSTWVAVTDKVATDAAAAAANALTVAQSKADASTVQSLTNTVSQQGQDLIAQGQALTAIDVSIGDAGGENLLYNPAFTKVNTVDPNVPDGWTRDGAAPNNSSMVESWLNAGERAFRSAVTGVTSGSPYLSLIPAATRRVKVGGSQTVTSSIYARRAATSGLLSLRLYFQWLNASGGVISAPFSTLNPISVDGSRHTLTALAPADAVAAVVYYRVHAPTTTATNGTVELARPQVEYGSRASGWRDSGQVNAANNAATSTAVENLTSAVNQQGDNLSSVAGRTTSLENSLTTTNQNVTTAQQAAQAAATAAGGKGEVIYGSTAPAADKRLAQNLWIDTTGNANTPKRWNGSAWVAVTDKVATDAATAAASALSQVATKAEASAVNSLTNRVSSAEGTLSSNSSDITQLKNSIGTAQPFVAGKSWEFIGSTLGWVGTISGSTFTAGPLFATAGKCPNLQCNFTPAIAGAENPYLRIRLRRRNTTRSGAQMYWANEDGGLAEARRMAGAISLTTNDWQDIEFDLSGHAGWNGKNIIAIRLDMMNSMDTSGEIDIAYIAVGRRSAAASAQAVASLESSVTQQGGKLTAEGLRIDGLYTAVGDANAAIQNEAKARVDGDGALSKQLQTTQASLGTTNAAVQQVATAQADMKGMLNAQYTVRVQVNNQYKAHVFAGFGIGINSQNGIVQSAFVINADQFILLNSSGGLTSPFSIVGAQTFIDDAYIRSASISNAKIADAAISNAKIANGAITAAKIGVAEIDTLRIRGNAVTVPTVANNPGSASGSGVNAWVDLIAVAVQMDEAGYLIGQFGCYQGFGSGTRRYMFQMLINDNVMAQGGGDWADGFPNLLGSTYVGPGYYVIKVRWWGENSGVGVNNMNLFAMGCKR